LFVAGAGALFVAGSSRSGRLLIPQDVQETVDPTGRSPQEGKTVTVEGVVAARSPQGDFYYLCDPAGGPWSGLKILGNALARHVGEAISVTGLVREEFQETRLVERTVHVDGTGSVQAPTVIHAADLVGGGEAWEGVVVRIEQVTVETEASGFGEWEFSDALGARAEVDDEFFTSYMPDRGDTFDSITGVCAYGFGDFHLEPRDDRDFVGWKSARVFDGRISFQVSDENGRGLPSKATLFPVGGPSLELGPEDRAEATEDISYLAQGAGELSVPAGTYDVVISRGPEYGLHQERVVVPSGGTAWVTATLVHEVNSSGWISADFHLHCAPSSDTPLPVPGRIVSLAAEGVEWAIATDHNMVTDYAPIIQQLGLGEWIRSSIGDEITTRSPAFGHFNAFPLPRVDAAAVLGMDPEALFSGARQSPEDEVVQVNHPSIPDWGDQYFDVYRVDPHTGEPRVAGYSWNFDALEVFNGRHLDQGMSTLETWMRMLNAGRFITATGNSDSHHLVFAEPGYPRNYVRAPDDGPSRVRESDLVRAVRAGEVFVSYGPFLTFDVNGALPGRLVGAAGGDAVMHARVQCAAWLSVNEGRLYANGRVIHTFSLPAPRGGGPQDLTMDFTDRPAEDTWYLLVVEGDEDLAPVRRGAGFRPLAFTNPVRVDADGDGHFTPPGNVADLVDIAEIDVVDAAFVPVRIGQWLAVRGCATTDTHFLDPSAGLFYVDDGTGGVQVREVGGAVTDVHRGDRVWVGGCVVQLLGETVLVDATVQVEAGSVDCASPHDVATAELASAAIEPWEGRVVRLQGVNVTGGAWPSGGAEGAVNLDDGSGLLLVIPQGVVVPPEASSLSDFTLTAIVAQHDFSPPYDGGYHLLLRSASDLPLAGSTLTSAQSIGRAGFGTPFPNPFRASLSVPYVAAPGSRLAAEVHDVRGRAGSTARGGG
jgi:hypothetical protein